MKEKTGSFIEFNSDTNRVEISSSNFLFGGGSQFVSGSNGNIEIMPGSGVNISNAKKIAFEDTTGFGGIFASKLEEIAKLAD